MTLFSLLDKTARRHPDAGAVFLGTEQVRSYAGLRSRALRLAAGLRARFEPGDRIAIFSENCPDYVELLFGIWAAGMAVAPINGKLNAQEVAPILQDSGSRALFVSRKLAPGLLAIEGGVAADVIQIGSAAYEALFGAEWEGEMPSDPTALAWLFFTSGTTGRPKGAMLSHRNLMALTLAHLADMDDPDPGTSLLHPAPMSHGSGLYIPAYVARGARQVIPASGGFEPGEFLDLCGVHPACSVFFAPTMVQRLRRAVEAGAPRPANLKTVIYGGGPMYLEEIKRSIAVLGPVFVQIYGLGETPMTITGLRRGDYKDAPDRVLGSVGYARSGVEVAVVDASGKAVPSGEVGEVICRSDVVMAGYWQNEAATAESLRNGWLWTGDMGALDEDGLLTLRDRSKDMIVTGGTNVYPREVEEVLLTHPQVEEACVVGVRDDEWGEIVVAVLVVRDGEMPRAADLDALCNARIARFKRPKRYEFRNELPKNNYGKVLKRALRDELNR